LPLASLSACRLEDPETERNDQARLLRDSDELIRRETRASRMPPADECLDANDPSGLELHDGLVVELELSGVDGGPQLSRQLETLQHPAVHARLKRAN